jgi:sortase (surface protein transpeptidase)
VRVPAIGISSRLESLRTGPDGTLQPPRDPDRAGWYVKSPAPGELGPAVIAGHVDSKTGPAVFWRLSQLRPGDIVTVTRSAGGPVRFVVQQVRRFSRAHPHDVKIYGPSPDRALRLITCGGVYDRERGRYQDNVVVFAVAV